MLVVGVFAFVAANLKVPSWRWDEPAQEEAWRAQGPSAFRFAGVTQVRLRWAWEVPNRWASPGDDVDAGFPALRVGGEYPHWPLIVLIDSFILLTGGGLLTWVVRSEQRRTAAI